MEKSVVKRMFKDLPGGPKGKELAFQCRGT